jgi:hypothetical protein
MAIRRLRSARRAERVTEQAGCAGATPPRNFCQEHPYKSPFYITASLIFFMSPDPSGRDPQGQAGEHAGRADRGTAGDDELHLPAPRGSPISCLRACVRAPQHACAPTCVHKPSMRASACVHARPSTRACVQKWAHFAMMSSTFPRHVRACTHPSMLAGVGAGVGGCGWVCRACPGSVLTGPLHATPAGMVPSLRKASPVRG